MIVVNTAAIDKVFNIIPRQYLSNFSLELTDDSINIPFFLNITNGVVSGNYLNFSANITTQLVENHFYNLRLFIDYNFWQTNVFLWQLEEQKWNEERIGDITIFRDRLFCTNQIIDGANNKYYNINQGLYTTFNATNDNQYKVFKI